MDKEKKEVGFGAILKNLCRRFWVVLIFAAICGFCMYTIAEQAVTSKYDSNIRLYINSSETSDDLVDVCGAVLESEGVLTEVVAQAELQYTAEELNGMLSYRDVNETNMIEITVRSSAPEEAEKIANPDQIVFLIRENNNNIINDYCNRQSLSEKNCIF